jgi:SAM-dependent methyltransferase
MHQQAFLRYSPQLDRYEVDWRETMSVAVGEALLAALLQLRPYMRGRLLDVGCGRRPYRAIYDRLVAESIGTEVAFSPHGLQAADVISFAERLAFANASFDTILCTEVLEHTRQPFEVMAEFARLLRPGGYLILSVPFIYPLHETPYDFWRFTPYGLAELCRSAGLRVQTILTKGGTDTTMLSLGANIAVRSANLAGKLLRLAPPLRDRRSFRWLVGAPQRAFLAAGRPGLLRDALSDKAAWLSSGFTLLAQAQAEAAHDAA